MFFFFLRSVFVWMTVNVVNRWLQDEIMDGVYKVKSEIHPSKFYHL